MMRRLRCSFLLVLLSTVCQIIEVSSVTTTTTEAPVTVTSKASTSTTSTVLTKTTSVTTTTTTSPTTSTTAATTTTTEAPALGIDCSNKTDPDNWCNAAISGSAECGTDDMCRCAQGHFQINITMCLPEAELEPTNLQTSDVTTSSLIISWSRKDTVDGLIIAYTVTARSAHNETGVPDMPCNDGSDVNTTCSGLLPGHLYDVTVTASYSNVHTGSNVKQESTFPNIPGELDDTSSDFNASSLTLAWTGSTGRVEFYNVKVTQSTDASNIIKDMNTTGDSQITIAGLVAGTEYGVFITAYSNGKSSEAKEDTFRTLTDVPGAPTNIMLESVTASSIKINWTITDQPNGDIRGHKVCLKQRVYEDVPYTNPDCQNTTGAGTREFEKTGLSAGTFCYFEVYTINDMYISTEHASFEQRINQTEPGKVNALKAVPNDTSIKVTWNRPLQPNGDIITYQIDWLLDQKNCTVYLKSSQSNVMPDSCYHNITDPPAIAVNQRDMEYTIFNLMPHTEYTIQVRAYTFVGPGVVESKTTTTSTSVPDSVTKVMADVLSATTVNVSWTVPEINPGPINYTVTTKDMIDGANSLQACSVQGYNSSSCVVSGLDEYWIYSFSVTASTDAGSSDPSISENVTTNEAEPGPISGSTYTLFNESNDCDATKVQIDWQEPALRERNSRIVSYTFQADTNSYTNQVTEPDPYAPQNRLFSRDFDSLQPERTYTWKISALSLGDKQGQETTFRVTQGVCAPPNWDNTAIESVEESLSGTSSVTISFPTTFFERSQQGSLQEKGLIVIPRESPYFDGSETINHGALQDWKASRTTQFVKEYKIVIKESVTDTYVVGEDTSCTTTGTDVNFCNGPLPETFSFKLAVYVCTSRTGNLLCTVSSPFGAFATVATPDKKGSDAWIIVVAVLLVLAVIIASFGLLWYKGIIDPKSWLPPGGDTEEEPPFTAINKIERHRPIPLSRYSVILEEMHRDTNLQLSDQYDDINKIGQIVVENSTTNAAKLESNTPKNRWVNILPFDHSRVKLQQIDEDDPTSDYINANYIPGFHNKREYIATQGPLPGTIDHFWRMVWEHNVVVIVMLTQCKEGNRMMEIVKCEQYWPDELREAKQYGDVVVNPTSISQLDKYNISIFDVSINGQASRQVIQFHYLDFPDFSANVEFDHFINFARMVRNQVPHDMTGPIVVHCSAGVGRTGTFIATDRLNLYLNSPQFDENDTVDIFGIVASMRENRISMVQTESQFIMIHDCFEKMFEDKKKSMQMTESEEHLYANQGFEPFPEVLYENVSSDQQQTEL